MLVIMSPMLIRLGSVEHTLDEKALVRIADPVNIPSIRSRVYDKERRFIGLVTDIIGPVSRPYAVVALKEKTIHSGTELFYEPPRRKYRHRE